MGDKGKPEVRVIEIPKPDLRNTTVHIRGITPLLTNRLTEAKTVEIEEAQQKKAKGPRPPRNPDAEWRAALHVIEGDPNIDVERGIYGFPAAGIKKALVTAGGRFADETMTILRGIIQIPGDLLTIKGSVPRKRTDRVRLKDGKLSLAYRPEFLQWEMLVPVRYNAALISEAQIFNLFQIAGFSVGIGDWRVECKGTFGQFELVSAEPKEDDVA